MTLFPEWQEAHKDAKAVALPLRIRQMRAVHGKRDDKTCKKCKFLRKYHQSATWFKCSNSKITGGAATDWRAGWPACGLYKEENE